MLTKVIEVYEDNVKSNNPAENSKVFKMREALINLDHVVCAVEDDNFKDKIFESGAFPKLNSGTTFLKTTINKGNFGSDIFICGDLNTLFKPLEKADKKVLKG